MLVSPMHAHVDHIVLGLTLVSSASCAGATPRVHPSAPAFVLSVTSISDETTNESSVMTAADELSKVQDHSVEPTGHDDARQTNSEGVAQGTLQHASQHHSLKHS